MRPVPLLDIVNFDGHNLVYSKLYASFINSTFQNLVSLSIRSQNVESKWLGNIVQYIL